MIRFQNVSKVYPRTGPAVSEITFHIKKSEFAFLTGHSGAGKSTLLKLIHFQTLPSEGQVQVSRYHSERIKRRDIPDLRRRVGFVFQDFKLLGRLTAAENVAFALEVTGTHRRDLDAKVQRLLTQVGLAAKSRSLPSELSGGERQRVVIARALATDPLVLLADEPTGNLDPRAADGVFELFRTLNQLGMAVLMATHDTELLRKHPTMRVLELEHGRLVYDSATKVSPEGSESAALQGPATPQGPTTPQEHAAPQEAPAPPPDPATPSQPVTPRGRATPRTAAEEPADIEPPTSAWTANELPSPEDGA